MQAIFYFSSMKGIALPVCQIADGPLILDPVSSPDGIFDSQQLAVSSAWNQLCLHLRRRVFERIESMPIGSGNGQVSQLLTGVQVIFPPSKIASQYRSLRLRQLDSYVEQHQLRSSSAIRIQSFEALVPRFSEFMSKVLVMMSEDFELFISGTFEENDFEKSFDCLGEIYFDRLLEEIKAVVDKLQRFFNLLAVPFPVW